MSSNSVDTYSKELVKETTKKPTKSSSKKSTKETTKKSSKGTTKKSSKGTTKKKKKYNYETRTITLPDGKRKYVYGKTKAEVEQKMVELRAELAGGVDVNDDTTFGELAKLWIDKYCAPYHRTNTVNTYRSAINTHLMPRLATLPVKSITAMHIQAVTADAINSGYESMANLIRIMREIFNVAVDIGCIIKSPVPASLKAPPRKTREQKYVLPRELEAQILGDLRPLSPERMVFQCGIHLGLRRGEIYGLDWEHIDLENDILYVRQQSVRTPSGHAVIEEELKTAAGRREVPISPTLHQELEVWGAWYGTEGLLFTDNEGNPFGDSMIRSVWTKIRRSCASHDPEYAKNFTLHVLRHTYVTRLFEAGLDIKEIQSLAGHKDVNITLSVYTHFDKGSRQQSTFDKVRTLLESNSARPNTSNRASKTDSEASETQSNLTANSSVNSTPNLNVISLKFPQAVNH